MDVRSRCVCVFFFFLYVFVCMCLFAWVYVRVGVGVLFIISSFLVAFLWSPETTYVNVLLLRLLRRETLLAAATAYQALYPNTDSTIPVTFEVSPCVLFSSLSFTPTHTLSLSLELSFSYPSLTTEPPFLLFPSLLLLLA
jgi:hypothetical protein